MSRGDNMKETLESRGGESFLLLAASVVYIKDFLDGLFRVQSK